MIIDSSIKVATICHSCGRINVFNLNLFKLKKDKEIKLSCSCGSLNAVISSRSFDNICLNINCVSCGRKHIYNYKARQLLKGIYIYCAETGMNIAVVGNGQDINRYIKESEKDTIDMIYDENFGLFFTNHSIMKECIERLQWLRKNGRVNCDCGSEHIVTEVFSDRIELRCVKCHSTKVIYAETRDDLNNFYCKNKINMHKYEFDFLDAIKNKE